MSKKSRFPALVWGVSAASVVITTGCHPAAAPDAPATGAAANPSSQPTVQAVKDNPNIPPEAKANILRQTQNRTGPPMPGNPLR